MKVILWWSIFARNSLQLLQLIVMFFYSEFHLFVIFNHVSCSADCSSILFASIFHFSPFGILWTFLSCNIPMMPLQFSFFFYVKIITPKILYKFIPKADHTKQPIFRSDKSGRQYWPAKPHLSLHAAQNFVHVVSWAAILSNVSFKKGSIWMLIGLYSVMLHCSKDFLDTWQPALKRNIRCLGDSTVHVTENVLSEP